MSDRVWTTLFLSASLAWASAVTFVLKPSSLDLKDPPPPRLRVSTIAGQRVPVAPVAPVEKVERLRTEKRTDLIDRETVKTAAVEQETPRVMDAQTVIEATATLPPQPQIPRAPASVEPSLPLIGAGPAAAPSPTTEARPGAAEVDLPEAPPNGISTNYPDVKPFGRSVVYAVLLDHEGIVQDVRIVIPSADALADLTYSMAIRGARIKLNPPLAVGELRWQETKIDYIPKSASSIIP